MKLEVMLLISVLAGALFVVVLGKLRNHNGVGK